MLVPIELDRRRGNEGDTLRQGGRWFPSLGTLLVAIPTIANKGDDVECLKRGTKIAIRYPKRSSCGD